MGYCIIISDRDEFLKVIGDIVKCKTLYELICIPLQPASGMHTREEWGIYEDPKLLLQTVKQKIAPCAPEQLRESVVIVDELVSPEYLDPLSTEPGPQQLYAMLILAFPEFQFVFLNTWGLPYPKFHLFDWLDVVQNNKEEVKLSTKNGQDWESAKQISSYPDCQLFDPHGIRETIKINIQKNHANIAPYCRPREHLALSIEDEPSYALFHAYAAYKSGYKCKVINSLVHLNNLSDEVDWNAVHTKENGVHINNFEVKLQFDDLFLNFYDRTGSRRLSDIQDRYENQFKILSEAQKKILVTVGQSREEGNYKIPESVKVIQKPGKGLYHLLDKACLLNSYRAGRDEISKRNMPSVVDRTDITYNHSTPGRLMLIAENLLSRAESIIGHADNVSDAIHAATLALEAKELLGGLTPTTALHALALVHKAEITAESLFYGVEYEMDLSSRFEDIKAETKVISRKFKKENQEKQHLNAYLNIVEHMAKEFNRWNQFDEELFCLHEARKVRHKLMSIQAPRGFRLLSRYFFWYVDELLFSFRKILLAIIAWVLFFGTSYFLIAQPCLGQYFGFLENWCLDIQEPLSYTNSLLVSLSSFFTVDTSPDWVSNRLNGHSLYVLLFTIESVIAFLHLSLLVSYGFLRLSRR